MKIKKYQSIIESRKTPPSLKESSNSNYFEARIFADTYEDDYKQGELEGGTSWTETIKDNTLQGLLKKVANYVNAHNVKDLEYQGDVNNYTDSTELWYSHLANDQNEREVSKSEIDLWKKGKLRLWSVNYHILLSSIGRTAVSPDLLKKFGID